MNKSMYKILAIESRAHYQMLLEFFFESGKIPHKIQFANTGEEAEIALQFSNPDLILLNSTIDTIAGQSALSYIRECTATTNIPILVILEESNTEAIREIVAHPFVDFVMRPLDKYIFLARVKTALTLRETLQTAESQSQKINEQVLELKLLSTVVEQSANSIAIFDFSRQLQWANSGYRSLFGMSKEEYSKQRGTNIEKLSSSVEVKAKVDQLFETKRPVEYISHIRTGKLEYKWVKTTLTPVVNDNGEICNFVAVGTDITNQKRVEDELVIQRDDIIAMTEDLKGVINKTQKQNEEIQLRNREIEREKQIIEAGKKRTEKLLMSVLPFEAAIQLKSKGEARPRNYKMSTVLFTDFKGFSKACMNLSPREVVNTVHSYFAIFDDITENRNIEKIKTIGDAYMCAGGIPLRNKSNPIDVVLAGLEIQHFMQHLDQIKEFDDVPRWELRLGIHTGPIIAGVVGKNKIAYDIWGDTVNVASRMETAGEAGRVNISGDTYELIKEYFDCTHRGRIKVKNRGEIDMYFVDSLKPKFALDQFGVKPNDTFRRFLFSL